MVFLKSFPMVAFSTVSLFALALSRSGVTARLMKPNELRAQQYEAVKRYTAENLLRTRRIHNSQQDQQPTSKPKNITFSNPLASHFYVDGSKLPLIDWDVGPSWAGLLPITGDPNETRKFFFWFFPPGPNGSLDDLIFWTNGGPGCSSLEGFLQENGPISWDFGQARATQNQYSWTNLSSVLWVEQPLGTGFSQGTPTARNEEDIAEQVVGFLQQFLRVFSELKGKKLYIGGESYAGMYIPYLADYIYSNPASLDLSLQGIWMADPVLSWHVVQHEIPAVDFVHKYQNVFALNTTFMKQVEATAQSCNYTGYMEKYVTYPPKGPLPLLVTDNDLQPECDVWFQIFRAAITTNPSFNIHHIFDTYPTLWDVLTSTPRYFNRKDVKEAIHAPVNVFWVECRDSISDIFPHGDASLPPAFTVLPGVIEKSKRSVIAHGMADYLLIADGTRIVIQNMTWNGKQGFQTPIVKDSLVVDGIGALGNVHEERGLAYYEVMLSGHMVPQYSPWTAFQSMQYLMGFRSTP